MNIVLLALVVIFSVTQSGGQESHRMTCDVVPIEMWGWSASRHEQDLRRPVGVVVVTHTVTSHCTTAATCEAVARAIRNNQIQQGLDDISLSYLVGGNGRIYEGAGWKVGCHTAGYNDKSISLSFIGDFRDVVPTNAALQAAENFLNCVVSNRNVTQDYLLVGHRQLVATISPGDALFNLIKQWPHWSQNAATRPH